MAVPIVGFCSYSMFCCALLCVHSSFAGILVEKVELVALLGLSLWCLVIVALLSLPVSYAFLQLLIIVLINHTHLLFFKENVY